MDIKILGSGCAKCKKLEQSAREAVAELGIDASVTKVEDIMEIMNFGIATTPAIVVDGKVLLKGRTASTSEIKKMISP